MIDSRTTTWNYEAYVNTVDGFFIATLAFTPNKLTPDGVPVPDPPPLSRLSDWMFVVWQYACGGAANTACIQNLKWVVHINVQNPSTQNAAAKAIALPGNSRPKWEPYPGYQFVLPQESRPDNAQDQKNRAAFNAMVGCPNGYGIAYMLQQRQDTFTIASTRQIVDQINVFGTDSAVMAIGWHIGPSPIQNHDG